MVDHSCWTRMQHRVRAHEHRENLWLRIRSIFTIKHQTSMKKPSWCLFPLANIQTGPFTAGKRKADEATAAHEHCSESSRVLQLADGLFT